MANYIDAPDATSGKRIGAGLIDVLVVGIIASIISRAIGAPTLSSLVWIAYAFGRDAVLGGGIGKRAMKLAVIREDGSTLEGDWATSIKHNLLVGIFGLIEFIMIVIGKAHNRSKYCKNTCSVTRTIITKR